MAKGNRSSDSLKNYSHSLDYLYGLQKFGMVFGLTQVTRILEALGNPHEEIQAIHIGGTNGKGSTAAMMASILQREGYRVGLYTSPHLVHFTERIKVNGIEIEEKEVATLTEWMRERIGGFGDHFLPSPSSILPQPWLSSISVKRGWILPFWRWA